MPHTFDLSGPSRSLPSLSELESLSDDEGFCCVDFPHATYKKKIKLYITSRQHDMKIN